MKRRRRDLSVWLGAAVCGSVLVGCASKPIGPQAHPDDGWTTSSPGGIVHVTVRLSTTANAAEPPLQLSAAHGAGRAHAEVLLPSPLGIRREDDDFSRDLSFVTDATRPVVASYTLTRGKRRDLRNAGIERVLSFQTARRARIDLVLRVFDDGFAFRYLFPQSDSRPHKVLAEVTGFRLPPGSRGTLSAHDRPGQRAPDYENPWYLDVPVGTPSPSDAGWSYPALFVTKDRRYVLVTESGLDGTYCGTHLDARSDGGLYRVRFPAAHETPRRATVEPSSPLPWSTPWRVVVLGDRLGTIVESSLVTDLAPPSRVSDATWIRPGRASWAGAEGESSAHSTARLAPFVDLAAASGWEYALVGPAWDMLDNVAWQGLLRRAAEQKVGLWVSSTRERMHDPVARDREMRRLVAAGVKGVVVDQFESDKQDVIRETQAILEDAATHRLLIGLRGTTVPRGWDRTYPHLMSVEAVRGSAAYLTDPSFALAAPAHNTVLVFTRNVVGPMDYAPALFSRTRRPRRTTWGHEMALPVVFESGLHVFPDTVAGYTALPDDARALLRSLPTAWDETRVLDGEPGRLAVIARRAGRSWYVAGINGEPTAKRVLVPMATLLDGGTFEMLLVADGRHEGALLVTKRTRNPTDEQSVQLLPYGGFALRLTPYD